MSTQAGRFTSGNVVIEKQSIGSVGSQNNTQGALETSDFGTSTLAFFHFNGDSLDDSGGGNDLTAASSPVPAFDQLGFFGRTQLPNPFDSDFAKYTSSSSFFAPTASTSISFGGWFRVFSQFFQSGLFIGKSAGSGDRGYNLITGNSDTFQLSASISWDGTNFVQVGPYNDIWTDGEWHHYVVVVDVSATTVFFYVDGQLIDSAFNSNLTTIATSTGDFEVGVNAADTPENFTFQDVFYAEEALSASAVNALYSKRFNTAATGRQLKAGHVLTSGSFPSHLTANSNVSFFNLNADANDDSGNGRNLTNNGSTTFTGLNIFGVSSIASLDGVDDYFSSADAFFNQGNPFVAGGWFNADWTDTTADFLFGHNNGGSDRGWRVFASTDGTTISFSSGNTSTSFDNIQLPVHGFVAGSWHHIIFAWDGSLAKGYIDGTLVTSAAQTAQRTTSGVFEIGATDGGTANSVIRVQDFFYVDGTLSDTEIRKIYAAKHTHNLNIPIEKQDWVATTVSESGDIAGTALTGFVADQDTNDLYLDFGEADPGEQVEIKLK